MGTIIIEIPGDFEYKIKAKNINELKKIEKKLKSIEKRNQQKELLTELWGILGNDISLKEIRKERWN